MKMNKLSAIPKIILVVAVALLFVAAMTLPANADLTYYFGDYNMFGAPQAGGVAPSGTWATATFIDVSPDNVQLTLSVTNNITSAENIGAFYFNYSGDQSGLMWTAVDTSASTPAIGTAGSYQADGDGLYDIVFNFPPPPGGSAKFQAGESVIYNISGTGLSASGFYELATPGTSDVGPFYAVAKLGGIPCGDTSDPNCQQGTTSAWSSGTIVPEPVSSTLFIVGACALGFRRFRKMKKA